MERNRSWGYVNSAHMLVILICIQGELEGRGNRFVTSIDNLWHQVTAADIQLKPPHNCRCEKEEEEVKHDDQK